MRGGIGLAVGIPRATRSSAPHQARTSPLRGYSRGGEDAIKKDPPAREQLRPKQGPWAPAKLEDELVHGYRSLWRL